MNAIAGGDVDGDGDVDVVVALTSEKIELLRNVSSRGDFEGGYTIADQTLATSISAVDLDGDGDLDIVAGNKDDDTLSWIENEGDGVFGSKEVITACEDGVFPTDLDDDGDLDAVTWGAASAWYENIGGQFGEPRYITKESPRKVSVADMDGDEDVDIVLTSGVTRRVTLLENRQGNFNSRHTLAQEISGQNPRLFVSDVDRDVDLDLLVTFDGGNRVAWFENRKLADVNDDGVFNSSDLVEVFIEGEYEDDLVGNSTFDEGDWNGDGEFNSSDLVLAFQSGTYVRTTIFSTDRRSDRRHRTVV